MFSGYFQFRATFKTNSGEKLSRAFKALAKFGQLLADVSVTCLKLFCSWKNKGVYNSDEVFQLSRLSHPWEIPAGIGRGLQKQRHISMLTRDPSWSRAQYLVSHRWRVGGAGPTPPWGFACLAGITASRHPLLSLPSRSPGEALLQKSFGVCADFPGEGIRSWEGLPGEKPNRGKEDFSLLSPPCPVTLRNLEQLWLVFFCLRRRNW